MALFDRAPQLAVADGGFASRTNERAAQDRGVRPSCCRGSVMNCASASWIFTSPCIASFLSPEKHLRTSSAIIFLLPAGRLLFHVLASIAEFERDLIVDRVRAGVARARAQGTHRGRPRVHRIDAERARELLAQGLSLRAVARRFKVHVMVVCRALAAT